MKRFPQSILLILATLILGLVASASAQQQEIEPTGEPSGYPVLVKVDAAEFEKAGQPLIDDSHEAACRVRAGNGVGSGTCFLIGENGDAFFLTNHHVAGKKNSNVQIEVWRDGKLQPALPGRVVLALINSGYVDVAVVRVGAQELSKYGKQKLIPISLPSDPAPKYSTIVSRGCPGGTWQTQFIGSVFQKDDSTIKFYPRPAGGRSGSSILDPETAKIVGLLAWSSGKPSHEQHGVDGYTNASGHGVAMTRDVIWNALQGKMTASALERAPDEVPLIHFMQEPQDEFQTDPEEYEASLRRFRERNQKGEGDATGGDSQDRPKLLPQLLPRNGGGLRLGDRLLGFAFKTVLAVLLLAGLVYGLYRLGKKFLVPVIGFLVISLPNSAYAQESYEAQMAPMAERWSVDAVSEQSCWMEPDEAIKEAGICGNSLIVLMTTENCPPCKQLKADIEKLAEATFLNHSFLTNLSSADPDHSKMIERLMPEDLKAKPRSYPVCLVYSCTTSEKDGSRTWKRNVILGNPFASDEKTATEQRPTLKQYLSKLGVR